MSVGELLRYTCIKIIMSYLNITVSAIEVFGKKKKEKEKIKCETDILGKLFDKLCSC